MGTVFLERSFDEPVSREDLQAMILDSTDCAEMYRIEWVESFLSADGKNMLCCFSAPDAEAIRTFANGDHLRLKTVHPGTLHESGQEGAPNVVVERDFDEPVSLEPLQAIEDAGAWCLEIRKVSFLRTYFSKDRTHMVCLYRAPDAESVRQAQVQAGMPFNRVWPCRHYTQSNLFN